jgi:hypothetical protein
VLFWGQTAMRMHLFYAYKGKREILAVKDFSVLVTMIFLCLKSNSKSVCLL